MYDNLTREQYTGAEKRAALENCVSRDSLDSMNGVCGWVPHEENPVDCMPKLKGNPIRMLPMFRTHKYRLVGETDELEHRRKYRGATGMENPRPSVWKDTRTLLKTADSPHDKLGTGKPPKNNAPKASGLEPDDHDDEWLIIDDDLCRSNAPQQQAQALAVGAAVARHRSL